MIQTIVEYLNLRIATLGRIADLHGITERRKREGDGAMVPYCYVGSGEFRPVELDNGNVGWWRGRSGFTMDPVQVIGRAVKQQRASYPLRFVAVLRRELSTSDDAFMPSRLAEDIANALNFDNGDIVSMLKAINVESRASGGEYDAATIWPTEFHTSIPDLRYDLAMVAIDVTIEVVGKYSCWEGECDTDPDILRLFNFCDPSVIARLTDTQITCLEAEFSDPCADATVTVNSTPFGTAPSGGSLDVEVVNGGSNPVGTIQAGQVVISNNATFINGVQVTDQEAEVDANIAVELDGNPSGSWNAMTQTWEVSSSPCAAANLEINGVQQETIASGGTFNLIATLDGVAGGSYNAGTNTLSFTSNTGWIRPSEWPAFPSTLTAADERFYGVVAVFENAYNQVGIEITNLAANIDWGDGTSVISNGATRVKVYDYATLAATVYQWPDGRNVKYVLVDITRVGGALVSVNFYGTTPINARGGNNFVDINCSLPNTTSLNLSLEPLSGQKAMLYCQRLRVWARPAAHNATNLLRGMRSLRVLQYPFSSIGVAANFSLSSGQLDDAGDVDLGTATQANSFWEGSQLKKHGNLTANSATSLLVGYAGGCLQMKEFGNVEATSCTSLSNMWSGCVVLTRIGLIDTPLNQSLNTTFINCLLLEGVEFTDCSAVTVTTNCFGNCVSLTLAIMPGLTRGVSFVTTAMGNYGMNLFANSIGTATGAQTITVTGTPFGALLTALDATAIAIRLVMTGKGYTVAN